MREENARLKERGGKKRNVLGRIALGMLLLSVGVIGMGMLAGWRLNSHGDDLGILLSAMGAICMVFAASPPV